MGDGIQQLLSLAPCSYKHKTLSLLIPYLLSQPTPSTEKFTSFNPDSHYYHIYTKYTPVLMSKAHL